MEIVKQRIACINEYRLGDDLSMEDKEELRKTEEEINNVQDFLYFLFFLQAILNKHKKLIHISYY